jgi:hypothetical protein
VTEPQWDSVKRAVVIAEDDRGPDSVECSPTSHYSHSLCLLDYSDFGPTAGFVCGCGCHDVECDDCGLGNGTHDSLCTESTDL